MKKKFNEDSFIEIDEKKTLKETVNISNETELTLKMDNAYQNAEYQAEIKRREMFNFYWRLKHIRINCSLPMSVFSFSQDKFIKHKSTEDVWQLKLFGLARPHIVKNLITSNSFTNPIDQFPGISNGYLGLNGFYDEVQMQSLYSGSSMGTHRASIPSWTIREITAIFDLQGHNLIEGRRFELDMSNGKLIHLLYSNNFIVEQQIYVHQKLKSLIVHEIIVQFLNTNIDVIVLKLPKDRKRDVSDNIAITVLSDNKYIRILTGVTHVNDQKHHEQHIYAYHHSVPEEIMIKKSNVVTKYYYLMSVNEVKEAARHDFDEGMTLIENNNNLFKQHDLVWKNIWSNSGVFMRRAKQMDVPLISAQYLINSNLPNIGHTDQYGAMGATGLGVPSNQGAGLSLATGCGGRIEYSQELWMINSQMLLHPQSVRAIINKRISQLSAAKTNALKSHFTGAKYPAAANELGEDLCRECYNVHFPSGLVALSLCQYLLATGDQTMFTNATAIGTLMEINDFFSSVINKYRIDRIESVPISNLNIVVKNSIFELGLIRESLMTLPTLTDFFAITPTSDFAKYILELHQLSQSIVLPFDQINNFHPPYIHFNLADDKLYLPDVVMLRYPLDHLVDVDLSVRNLRVYEKKLFQPPSAMSLSVLFINNMDADLFAEAENNFRNILNFSNNKFKVWTNDSHYWKGSYIPAASSYLDSIVFGLLGVRIRRSGLYLFPKLIMDITMIEVSNLHYLGSTIRVMVSSSSGISVQIVRTSENAWKLGVMNVVMKTSKALDGVVTFPLNTHFVIKRLKSK